MPVAGDTARRSNRLPKNSFLAQYVVISSRAVSVAESPQDAQKGRPARPQRAKGRIVLVRYGEPRSDARTPLADFLRILLNLKEGTHESDDAGKSAAESRGGATD